MATSPTEPSLALQLSPICHCQITVIQEAQRVTCVNCCVVLLDAPLTDTAFLLGDVSGRTGLAPAVAHPP